MSTKYLPRIPIGPEKIIPPVDILLGNKAQMKRDLSTSFDSLLLAESQPLIDTTFGRYKM